jgi:predicted O-methyltransferase YrrM
VIRLEACFELQKGLDYIADLQPTPARLKIDEEDLQRISLRPPLDEIGVSLLELLILSRRSRRILEIGTSIGRTCCRLGAVLQETGGTMITVEIDPQIAAIARENVCAAGLQEVVQVICGDASEAVDELDGPFDLILQDGDKNLYTPLLDRLVKLLKPGGFLVTDDVLFPIMDLPVTAAPWKQIIEVYNRTLRGREDLRTVWLPVGYGISLSMKR